LSSIIAELSKREVGTLCAPFDPQQKTVRTSIKVFCFLSSLSLAVLTVVLPTADATRNRMAVIDIVGFNDVYEMLHDDVYGFMVGGPSRVIPIVKDTRCKNMNSLVIFAGGTVSFTNYYCHRRPAAHSRATHLPPAYRRMLHPASSA
jgi:hypothetical protein